jgi:hypothetical protein
MNEPGLDIYKDVWCVITYGDTEIYRVYLDKNEAIKIAHENNERRKTLIFYNPKHPICEVKSLADAIDLIRDAWKDQMDLEEYYRET